MEASAPPDRGMRELRVEQTVREMAVLLQILFLESPASWTKPSTPSPKPKPTPK